MEVFILESKYVRTIEKDGVVTISENKEINAVYSTEESARNMGEWLIKQEAYDGMKYVSYEIHNFEVM